MYLVLDNSRLQDFKHAYHWFENDPQLASGSRPRALRSRQFVALCQFVLAWSDRPTYLTISPVGVYEYMGRPAAASRESVAQALREVTRLLAPLKLEITHVGFNSAEELLRILPQIRADEAALKALSQSIDRGNWRRDLKTKIGVKIPYGIAQEVIPGNLPLQYFDPWYVTYVYRARVEHEIIKQSQHEPHAARLHTFPRYMFVETGGKPRGLTRHSAVLARLVGIDRKGRLSGLGDLELLQLCDIRRQQQQQTKHVMVGETTDEDLADVLFHRHSFHARATIVVGSREMKQQVDDVVNLLTRNPFSEYEARGAPMNQKAQNFREVLFDLVSAMQRRAPGTG